MFPAPTTSLGRKIIAVVHEFPGLDAERIADVLEVPTDKIEETVAGLDRLRYVRRDALGGITSTEVWNPDEDEIKNPVAAG